jgi:hypothetical protein
MKQKLAVFLLVLSIIAYASLISLAAFRIIQSRSEGIKASEGDFASMGQLVRSSLIQGKDYRSKIFIEQMRTAYGRSPRLRSLVVRDDSLRVVYAIPAAAALPFRPEAESKLPAFLAGLIGKASAYSIRRMNASIDIPGAKPLGIEAVYTTLSTEKVQDALRDSLIGILGLLFIAVVIRLVFALSQDESDAAPARQTVSDYAFPAREPAAGLNDEFEVPSFDIDGSLKNALQDPPATSPAGLYSPRSGLGWESYLSDRLDSELARCASLGLDCAFIRIECPGILSGDPAYGNTASAIKDFFAFKDIAFEYGRSGFAVVLPGKNIEQALQAARDFHKELPGGALIGLSSRSGRHIDSTVIIQEAGAALERAGSSADSPVIGFKADPDRYRNYVSGRI